MLTAFPGTAAGGDSNQPSHSRPHEGNRLMSESPVISISAGTYALAEEQATETGEDVAVVIEKMVALGLAVARSRRQADRAESAIFDDGVRVGASLIARFAERLYRVMEDEIPAAPTSRPLANGHKLELVSNS